MRKELTCVCGRVIPERDQIAYFGRRPCPDCGSRARKWSRSWSWRGLWRRLFHNHEWPRFRSGRGPRHFSPDWGFVPQSLTLYTAGVAERLGLRRKKNRWRFDGL